MRELGAGAGGRLVVQLWVANARREQLDTACCAKPASPGPRAHSEASLTAMSDSEFTDLCGKEFERAEEERG